MDNKNNEIFIYMDDSGKLNNNESCCIFGGIFFYNSQDISDFINQYRSIIDKFKCKYCEQCKENCDNNCVEIKGSLPLKQKYRRWIYNLEKQQKNFVVFIKNEKIYKNIMESKGARGRYLDYAQKRIIKEIILYSIRHNKIDLNRQLNVYIKIDECKTKSNGYYNLEESVYEELVNGIINYDYSIKHEPIIKNGLKIKLNYYDSKYNFGIQSADMMANYLHKLYDLNLTNGHNISSEVSFVEVKLFLP